MTLCDFVNYYLGEKVDYDGAYGVQCVDLYRMFIKKVLRYPQHTGAVQGAKDLYLKHEQLPKQMSIFNKIETKAPQIGDVCVWGATSKNPYGHVAICLGYTEENHQLLVFEQDGFKRDGAKVASRNPDTMLGVLRFKGGSVL